jgi:ATP-dependent DNA helicase PIF1
MSEYEYDSQLDQSVGLKDAPVPCRFINGVAGTGKTHKMRQAIADEPTFGVLASTTGISAVNLGAITINSLLKYFNTESLEDKFMRGHLATTLHRLALCYDNLVIDEISMMDALQLDFIYQALKAANGYKDIDEPMGIIAVGDFCQLPPVKARWAFEAECWPEFDKHTETLTENWRTKNDPHQAEFVAALTAARQGNGAEAARLLTDAGVKWHTSLENDFDGTTILPMNDEVSRYNWRALSKITKPKITVESHRWGQQRSEWGQNSRTKEWGIPPTSEFKIGAYIMLLANKSEEGELIFANGDCGHIRDYQRGIFSIELQRNGEIVEVGQVARNNESKDKPDGWYGDEDESPLSEYCSRPHVKGAKQDRRYVVGQVKYYPMRLAYASTVHKSQGLSLDRCQIDIRNHFFSAAAMEYVAISRCRTLEGLRLVGMREKFAANCKTDAKVARWL